MILTGIACEKQKKGIRQNNNIRFFIVAMFFDKHERNRLSFPYHQRS